MASLGLVEKQQMKLYLIPIPLAEETVEQVLPIQIQEVVAEVDTFFVENIRTARRFISSLKLGKVIDDLTFYELSKDTPEAETLKQLKTAVTHRKNIGVMSEAGCPGIADPGAVAVKIAHQLGIEVVPLVGPSSILLALMASGMNGQSFVFHGYLPIEKEERNKALQQLSKEAKTKQQTQIFIETPYRNNVLFEAILEVCPPDLILCVACDITAKTQFIKSLSIQKWKSSPKPELHKRPTVFLLV